MVLKQSRTSKIRNRTGRRSHRDVAVLAYDGMATFELGIAVEMFGLRRTEFAEWYRFKVCGLENGPLNATGGLRITPECGLQGLSNAGTIIIPGWRTEEDPPEDLVRILRRAHARGARLVSICSGAFVIARTGLLDGRRATTHWRYAGKLAEKYPAITIEPDVLYVDEGDILTSAGSAAGIDLCLHMVQIACVTYRLAPNPWLHAGVAFSVAACRNANPVDAGTGSPSGGRTTSAKAGS